MSNSKRPPEEARDDGFLSVSRIYDSEGNDVTLERCGAEYLAKVEEAEKRAAEVWDDVDQLFADAHADLEKEEHKDEEE